MDERNIYLWIYNSPTHNHFISCFIQKFIAEKWTENDVTKITSKAREDVLGWIPLQYPLQRIIPIAMGQFHQLDELKWKTCKRSKTSHQHGSSPHFHNAALRPSLGFFPPSLLPLQVFHSFWVVEPSTYCRWSVWRIGYESADHLTPLPGQWTGRGELPTILIYRCLFLKFLSFLFSFLSPSQGSYSGWKSAFPGPLLSCRDVRYLSDTKLVWVGWHPPTHPLVKIFHFVCVKIHL